MLFYLIDTSISMGQYIVIAEVACFIQPKQIAIFGKHRVPVNSTVFEQRRHYRSSPPRPERQKRQRDQIKSEATLLSFPEWPPPPTTISPQQQPQPSSFWNPDCVGLNSCLQAIPAGPASRYGFLQLR